MSTRPRPLRRAVTLLLTALATALSGIALAPVAQASTIVTPGDFTGYAFDQCHAPSQRDMNHWLRSSPYWAVGIYISGDSRFCRDQPNLTPAWIDAQLSRGWRLLPITLGPQAACSTNPRYRKQVRINPNRAARYAKARRQGRLEAVKTRGAAQSLGIAPGSTLWYDIENFDTSRTDCRESALSFLSAWTNKLHALGYQSGVYSSSGSGIKMLDDARATRPGAYRMPDQIWIARWDGRADLAPTYVRADGWMPHARVHQYRGGHDETWGGVTINVDSSYLDLGKGSVARPQPPHCGGIDIDFPRYGITRTGDTGDLVLAGQCVLTEMKLYDGPLDGVFSDQLAATISAYRSAHGLGHARTLPPRVWMSLLARGPKPLLKYGAAAPAVRRLQRVLNAADNAGLAVTGTFEGTTTVAVKRYQRDHEMAATGVVSGKMWRMLAAGTR
jgi:hypothetical protein